jgi:purine-binding chemotaxis protein CheW
MTATATSFDTSQYVTLGIDKEVFAVPVDTVREILDMRPISWVPNAPPFMLGMIDVRGTGVPVIDLRIKLGLPPVPATENTRILVLEVPLGPRSSLLGLVADRVFEVAQLADQEPPPEVGVHWRSDYIKGIARRDGGFVIIFDLARLLTSEEAALIPGEG